mgnify:CR=1 FL=1
MLRLVWLHFRLLTQADPWPWRLSFLPRCAVGSGRFHLVVPKTGDTPSLQSPGSPTAPRSASSPSRREQRDASHPPRPPVSTRAATSRGRGIPQQQLGSTLANQVNRWFLLLEPGRHQRDEHRVEPTVHQRIVLQQTHALVRDQAGSDRERAPTTWAQRLGQLCTSAWIGNLLRGQSMPRSVCRSSRQPADSWGSSTGSPNWPPTGHTTGTIPLPSTQSRTLNMTS